MMSSGHGGDGDDRYGVQIVGELGPGVAPVDAGVDVVVPGGLALIAVVGQNLIQVLPRCAGRRFSASRPGSSVPVMPSLPGGVTPTSAENRVHPALGDEDVVGHDGLVVLPPAGEGEGLGGGMAVHVKGEGELRPDLRLHAQQLQHMGVGGGLVGALLRAGEPSTGSQYIQWASLASA